MYQSVRYLESPLYNIMIVINKKNNKKITIIKIVSV